MDHEECLKIKYKVLGFSNYDLFDMQGEVKDNKRKLFNCVRIRF